MKGIAVAVWVNTLPRLQRGEPWYEIGVDDPDRRRRRYPEPVGPLRGGAGPPETTTLLPQQPWGSVVLCAAAG
ncbi:hypothetical protein [Streptomyces sp. NPDC018947]|uniref:hypothetical protein n=1 Tax=Streptomyces sp. NPDC018947 TaxID=3365054 RepID=UPI0037A5291D